MMQISRIDQVLLRILDGKKGLRPQRERKLNNEILSTETEKRRAIENYV